MPPLLLEVVDHDLQRRIGAPRHFLQEGGGHMLIQLHFLMHLVQPLLDLPRNPNAFQGFPDGFMGRKATDGIELVPPMVQQVNHHAHQEGAPHAQFPEAGVRDHQIDPD